MTDLRLDSCLVAKYVAQCCEKYNYNYNNTKIQKLTYFAVGAYLAAENHYPLLELPQAWPYGPVFPTVFFYYKQHGDIVDFPMELAMNDDAQKLFGDYAGVIVKNLGELSATALSDLSHKKHSPWWKASEGGQVFYANDITVDLMRPYFKEMFTSSGGR